MSTSSRTSVDASAAADEAVRVREKNIRAMLNNTVQAERTAVMPRFLKVRARIFINTCECFARCLIETSHYEAPDLFGRASNYFFAQNSRSLRYNSSLCHV
jgi:hypothetical protein